MEVGSFISVKETNMFGYYMSLMATGTIGQEFNLKPTLKNPYGFPYGLTARLQNGRFLL
jgi:hypothetical protein